MGSGNKGFEVHWTLPMDIGDQQQKKIARLVPKWPSYVNSVFLRWRVAAGAAGKRREGGWEAEVKYSELTGTCLWTLVTNSKKNQLDSSQNGQVMSILVFSQVAGSSRSSG